MREKDITLQIAQIVPCTEAEGPGRRFAIWFQGCPLRCPGCCNPQMLSFEGGTSMKLAHLLGQIKSAQAEDQIEGVTLMGGEPFAHAVGAARLAQEAQGLGLSVMVFSGFILEDLRASAERGYAELLAHTDILVDGPYLQQLPESARRWIGSRNQRIHYLSKRCFADDPRWAEPNTLEIRLADGELSVNGFPALCALGMRKRPRGKIATQK